MTTLSLSRILGAGLFLLPMQVTAQDLPPGEGRDLVEATCTACHGTRNIVRSLGYTAEGWKELSSTMVDLDGEPELDAIAAYLAEHFPPDDKRKPVRADGPMQIEFEAWSGPTRGQRARDPVEAPDGSIWWTGQWADVVTRLDPETGEMREYDLPDGARAHTVTAAEDGTIWYTGNGNGTMGSLDPDSSGITEYPMPDPAAGDPHSAIVAPDGRVYFTVQRGNMVGRLDPATGTVDLVTMPVPGSRPYGIKQAGDGTIWVGANGSNRLYSVDLESLAVTSHEVPHAVSHVRRLDIAPDGTIWYVNSGRGRLGHYDPVTGALQEWPSPSGPESHPYAIAWFDGAVWYNESGVRPDMLVRFDPDNESFQSWPIPSGNIHAGILRHMRVTRDGTGLLIHQSATNIVMRVRVQPAS
jgi:virginiamycin B lyase